MGIGKLYLYTDTDSQCFNIALETEMTKCLFYIHPAIKPGFLGIYLLDQTDHVIRRQIE